MSLQDCFLPSELFSNGPIPDTEPMLKALDTVKTLGCKIETAKIDRLVAAESPEVGVIVYLTDGRSTHVGYLADRPTTVLSSRNLVLQLGLEIESHPFMGEQIKDVELDGTTRVPGVFVAGDAVTPLKSAPNAISSGKLPWLKQHSQRQHVLSQLYTNFRPYLRIGSNAAAVVVQHLMAEDLQIRLASCPT